MIHIYSSQQPELHETPIKKSKSAVEFEPKTAESPEKNQPSLKDVDAEELFAHFDQIVKVTEEENVEQEECGQEVHRKLSYDAGIKKGKLIFSPRSSSMKKKAKIGYELSSESKMKCIMLFEIAGE